MGETSQPPLNKVLLSIRGMGVYQGGAAANHYRRLNIRGHVTTLLYDKGESGDPHIQQGPIGNELPGSCYELY
jgi:hypothetical protein